jgi:hypothetical protein
MDTEVSALPELTQRIAEQIAFGQVHRLFSGGYSSSNLTLSGALLDYGGMRSLPNWVNARTLDGIVGFGEEMKILHKLIESLSFYFSKYRTEHCPAPPPADSLRSLAQSAYDRVGALRECFASDPDREERLFHAWSCAARHLLPRDLLDRERLQRLIERRLSTELPSNSGGEWIDEFVRTTVGQTRRHWPRLPADLTVQAHAAYEGSSALLCVELRSRRKVYWLEGVRVSNTYRLFDTCFSTDHAKAKCSWNIEGPRRS